MKALAGTASITLCILGYGSSLPIIYQLARHHILQQMLMLASVVGLASLALCDAIYSTQVMDQAMKKIKVKSFMSPVGIFFGILISLNAIANSQITSAGKALSTCCLFLVAQCLCDYARIHSSTA